MTKKNLKIKFLQASANCKKLTGEVKTGEYGELIRIKATESVNYLFHGPRIEFYFNYRPIIGLKLKLFPKYKVNSYEKSFNYRPIIGLKLKLFPKYKVNSYEKRI